VTRTEHDGAIRVLMDKFDGKPLNAPNDVVVSADGAVWFTDPGFGKLSTYESDGKAPLELPPQVYRLDPRTGRATVVFTPDAGRPNGIAFSPDEKKLYIILMAFADNRPAEIRVFDVMGDRLANGKVFARDFEKGNTDGIRLDTEGNVWCSMGSGDPAEDGVRCYAPDGTLIGKIHLPETCANFCFGGKKKNRLFMCGSTSIYAVYVDAVGALVP
jgi:gluconolactonase